MSERIYFEHFWNDFAAGPKHSVPEVDRQFYAEAITLPRSSGGTRQPGRMRVGFEVFQAFAQDANDFAQLAQTGLTMPLLVLAGEKASGEFLIQQGRLVAENAEGPGTQGTG